MSHPTVYLCVYMAGAFLASGCLEFPPAVDTSHAPSQPAKRDDAPGPRDSNAAQDSSAPAEDSSSKTPPEEKRLLAPSRQKKEKPEPINLKTAMWLAATHSIQVEIFAERQKAAGADALSASWWANLLPTFFAGGELGRSFGSVQDTDGTVFEAPQWVVEFRAGAQWRPDLLALSYWYEGPSTEELVEAAKRGGEWAEAEAILQSALLYYDLLQAYELQSIATKSKENYDDLLKRVRDGPASTVARANQPLIEAAAASAESNALMARGDVERASADLTLLLRMPPEVSLEPKDKLKKTPLVDPSKWLDLLAIACASRPDLLQFEAMERAAQLRFDAVKLRTFLPEVRAYGSLGAIAGGPDSEFCAFNDTAEVGINFVWTFDGLGIGPYARRKRAEAEAREAELQAQAREDQAQSQILRLSAELNTLDDRLGVATKRVEAANRSLDEANARFGRGAAGQLEVLRAIHEATAAKVENVVTTVAYNKAQHILQHATTGSTTKALNSVTKTAPPGPP